MHNPIKTEADAFRVFVIVGIGGAVVVAVGLIVSSTAGAIVLAVLLAIGAYFAFGAFQGAEERTLDVAKGGGDVHRVLVVANQTVGGNALLEEIVGHTDGKDSAVYVISPAIPSSTLAHWASDIDEAVSEAEARLEASLGAIRARGLRVEGRVGDADPSLAMEDALRDFPANELIISTLPQGRSKWLEHGVIEKAKAEVPLPLTHVVVDA